MGSGASSQSHLDGVVVPAEAGNPTIQTSGSRSGLGSAFLENFREECQKVQQDIDERVEAALKEAIAEHQKTGETLPEEEKAALRHVLKENDAESHPAWDAQDALSEVMAKILSASLVKGFLPEGGCPKNMDIAFVRALAREAPASILKHLQQQQTLENLAERIHQEAVQITREVAATGADLNDKYLVASDKGFTMKFGSTVDFSKGLERLIGSPNPNLLFYMIQEHCASCDSRREWTTGNYGITTNSCQEFMLVLAEVIKQCGESSDDEIPGEWRDTALFIATSQAPLPAKGEWPTQWPKETKNVQHGGGRNPEAQRFIKELLILNKQLAKSGDKELLLEEGIMLRLYTGPLFEKYNVVPRGGSLDGCDNPFMEQRFRDLCCDLAENGGSLKKEWIENRYPTSIHVLSSGVIKLSTLSQASTVYRGLGGNLLPKAFWAPDKFGCKGGVEFGFMSTTRDRNVATQYAGAGSVRMVLEIETGIIDRGADLRTLSQYPEEAELLFPPLTCLQVLKTKSERGVLLVKTRANVNLKGGTIDEVISKRYQVLKTMAEANTLEADQLLRSSTWPRILSGWDRDSSWVDRQLLNDFRKVMQRKMQVVLSGKATAYNDDSTFLTAVRDLVQLQSNCKVQHSSLLHDVANEANHARLLHLAEAREAMEAQKSTVSFSFKAKRKGSGSLWLFDVLGFEKAIDGLYYHARDRKQYRGSDNLMRDVATKDVELPGDGWALLAINRCRDLQLQAEAMQSTWNSGTTMEMVLELSRPTSRQDFGKTLRQALATRVGAGELTNLLLSNHRCEDLDLHQAGLDDEQGASFTQALSLVGVHLGNLELLMFGWNPDIRSKTASGLANVLASEALPKLRYLRLSECSGLFAGVDPEAMRAFCQGLARCAALEELHLDDTGLTSSTGAGQALAEALPKCTKLRRLELHSNPKLFDKDPAGSAAFCRALGGLGNLEVLYVYIAGLTSGAGAGEALAEALPKCTKLRKLMLGNNPQLFNTDPVGSAAFCRALGVLSDLKELRLQETGLTSGAGVGEALAEVLPMCAKLRDLGLQDNKSLDETDRKRVRETIEEARERGGLPDLESFDLW